MRRFPVRFRSGKTKGTAFAVPSAYGVIIKLSRVETSVDNTSVLRIHQDGSGFSSCNRRSGTEVASAGIALHQAGGLHQVHALLGPASNGGVIGEQLTGGLGQLKGVAQDGSSLLTGDSLVGLEGAVLVAGQDAVLDQKLIAALPQ